MKRERLLLFDLDGTLVDTGGAGLAAFNEAIRLVFGADGPELDLAGATDGGLLEKVYEHFAYEPTEKSTALFFENYLERLEYNLADPCYGGRLLEGGKTILRELMELGIPMGLLTGNTAAGAEVKVRHYGIDGYFSFGAYGDDHANRNFLGPLALKRAEKTFSRSFEPEEAVIIGDTPKDIACSRYLGAQVLAVATGAFSVGELEAAGADLVVQDLKDESQVLDFLVG